MSSPCYRWYNRFYDIIMQFIAMNKLTLPNLLSGSRLILSVASAFFICQQQWMIAAGIFIAAVISDLLDGWVARRLGQTTIFGGLLDHASDAIFVIMTLAALAVLDLVPLLLPILIAAAFLQYVLDSNALAGQPLRASSIGRYNGIAYFVLAGFPIGQQALQVFPVPMGWLNWAGWMLVVTTIISISDRLIALVKLRMPG